MSKKQEEKQEPEKTQKPEHKTRGWVGKKAGTEEIVGSLDKNLENTLKKEKKKEK